MDVGQVKLLKFLCARASLISLSNFRHKFLQIHVSLDILIIKALIMF